MVITQPMRLMPDDSAAVGDEATEMGSQATIRSIPMVLGGAEVEGLAALAVKMTAAERCWLLGPEGW